MKHNKQAFTLIELLVVVLIIGILAAVAMPQYQKAVEKTRLTEALILGKHIQQLEQIYYLANGTYTNSFIELGLDIPAKHNVIPSVPHQLNSDRGPSHFTLEADDNNKRVIYYCYISGNSLDLALFFVFGKRQQIDCLGYTDQGRNLCATLNY